MFTGKNDAQNKKSPVTVSEDQKSFEKQRAFEGQNSFYEGQPVSSKKRQTDIEKMMAQEAAPAYWTNPRKNPEQYILELGRRLGKRQGEFTIADRESLPDDIRTELIDGVIYLMASPTSRHQIVAGQIYYQLCNFLYSQDGPCTPFIAPSDVKLDEDDKTVVQPDVYIVCKKDKEDDENKEEKEKGDGENEGRIDDQWPSYMETVPVFVAEVLSPSSKKKDMFIKAAKYCSAGVREYWVVDPEKEKIIVHRYDHDSETGIYGFDSCIPVGVYDGACRIDFPQIRERVERYYR